MEISDNSNLQTIEDGAFQSSKINQFCFPSSMSEIGHFSFSYCNGLKMVEISENTNIQSIPETSFHSSNPIVMIPSSLRKLVQEDDKIWIDFHNKIFKKLKIKSIFIIIF